MATSPDGMRSTVIANLVSKTGKSLVEWMDLLLAEGPARRKDQIDWLKARGLGHVQAQIVADEVAKPADFVPSTPAELLEGQYAGDKAGLRPIYERLAAAAVELGPDARLDARKTYVSLQRRRQFGIIEPSTRAKVSLGLILPGVEPTGRLRPAAGWGSGRTTHRVDLASPDEVDVEVLGWLAHAYHAEGG
ncbi:MAG: DUF5655 domain-containing protein [Chloroflexota bacterium]